MTAEGRLRIERLLGQLGYLSGGIDGAITVETRAAIRTYQRDIGAPQTGFVTQQLLDSLQLNTGQAVQAPAVPAPSAAAPVPSPRVSPAASPRPATSSNDDDDDGGGGGGGDDGSVWN